ncbi:MAG: sialate O-acetylesterase [bacterium]|nr:sialate O-acetylesterase [bacterium]
MSLKLAAVFSDNCVLQRNKNITVFGSGEEGRTVEAVLSGRKLGSAAEQVSRAAGCVRDGKFEILMPSLQAGVEHTLEVRCGTERIIRRNIAIGEVWLAGGQSNMELELRNCAESRVLKKPANNMLRFYYTQKKGYMNEEFFRTEEETAWTCFGDKGTECWSAVGYFFAARLQTNLRVPVGIIGCNWGGTSASAWMPREALERDPELKVYVDRYEEAVAGKTEKEQEKEYRYYEKYQAIFDKRAAAYYAKNPDAEWEDVLKYAGESMWPGPMCYRNPFRPGGLYQCMVQRIVPYTLRGFLYYQGESDDHLPHLYKRLFARLIEQWREDWQDDELPFVFAQLPMHRYKQDPDFRHWCLIREAQSRVRDTVRNTAMACIIDQGEFNEIHPKRKKEVGERMCDQALQLAYGAENAPKSVSPRLEYADVRGHEIVLHIKNAEGGLRVKIPEKKEILTERQEMLQNIFIGKQQNAAEKKEELRQPESAELGFEVAGEDGKYVSANAVLDGDRVILSAREVERPIFARYLWTNYGEVYVYGGSGMPLEPFRTSRRDGFLLTGQNTEIRQKMETAE